MCAHVEASAHVTWPVGSFGDGDEPAHVPKRLGGRDLAVLTRQTATTRILNAARCVANVWVVAGEGGQRAGWRRWRGRTGAVLRFAVGGFEQLGRVAGGIFGEDLPAAWPVTISLRKLTAASRSRSTAASAPCSGDDASDPFGRDRRRPR
jgi:hypothetical protein